MRVLVLTDLPVALPAGLTPIRAAATAAPALVVLKGPASFQTLALAAHAQRQGAWLVALWPPPALPEDLVPDERLDTPTTDDAERECLDRLRVLRGGHTAPARAAATPVSDAALAAAWRALGQAACVTTCTGEIRAVNARFAEPETPDGRDALVGRALGEVLGAATPDDPGVAELLARAVRSGAERGHLVRALPDGRKLPFSVGLVRLPAHAGEPDLVAVTLLEAGEPAEPSPPITPIRDDAPILIVDDERDLRESLAWLLDPMESRLAGSLEEARAILSTEPIRAILCDLQLSPHLGTDLLPWLAVHRPMLLGRFAVMTGGAVGSGAATALQDTGVPVLEKPFSRDAVAALLVKLCGVDLDRPETHPGNS
jgi:ActR/RegA family two-component response regulator